MKYLKYIFLIVPVTIMILSCNQESDICLQGGTPRMKVKFKDTKGRVIRLDTLYLYVNYGTRLIKVDSAIANVDSVFVPLRVDGVGFTNIYVKKRRKENKSVIKMNYTEQSNYVSPACGIRKTYQNVSSEVTASGSVTGTEQNQTAITDENKIITFFIF